MARAVVSYLSDRDQAPDAAALREAGLEPAADVVLRRGGALHGDAGGPPPPLPADASIVLAPGGVLPAGSGLRADAVLDDRVPPALVAAVVGALREPARPGHPRRATDDAPGGPPADIDRDTARSRLAAIVESSDDAIISKDLTGTITSWNRGAERIFGYTAGEAIGRHITLIIPEALRDEEARILERLRRNERIEHFQTVRQARDGRLLDISLTISPVRDGAGRVIGASKVARDVTERRRAEEALRRSEARERARAAELEAIMDVAPAMVLIARDPRCALVTGNQAAVQVLGSARGANLADALAGGELRVLRDGRPLAPGDLPTRRAARGEEVRGEEIELHAGGRAVSLYGNAAPLRDPDGAITGSVAVFVDVTELNRTREELARRVYDLARSNAELQDFAYVASHDLKEPLRGIASYAQMLLEDYGDTLDAPGREKLRALVRLPKRMYDLLDALMDFARLGRAEPRLEDVDAADAAEAALDSLRPWLAERGAQVALAPGLPTLRADRVLLGQVFANLITNAVKYNRSPVPRVEIGATDDGAIAIRDNGIGIPERHHAAIFRMYKRLHARDAFGGGAGVGLAIVKKVADLLGGRLWLQSREGEGSTFFLRLPHAAGAPIAGRGGAAESVA
ncbi:MAG: PAS domain S-box protein [Phycisphaerales bacterium]